MNILLVITKGDVGGAQVVVYNMARALKEKGHIVTVGMGEGEFLKNKLEEINIPVHIFKNLKRTNNPFKNIKFIFEIKKYLDKNQFDIVHFNSSNSLFGAIGAKISKNKIKTIFTFHGLSILDSRYKNIFKIFYKLTFKFLLIFINENIFVSYNNLKEAKKINLINDGNVIYNGLDEKKIDFYEKDTAKKILIGDIKEIEIDSYMIGIISRLTTEKNHKFIIDKFTKILEIRPNAICFFIGDGPYKPYLIKYIHKLHLEKKIFILGKVENASKYLKMFDLIILPSYFEGLSISLIETIFAKIPAIASDVGGNTEVIGDKFIYKFNNEKEFLDLFENISKNKISQDFNKQKSLFSITEIIINLEKIYK
ncbi:MAG: glycosyltransferase [Candidatus Nomurabacteria bacterium]